MKYELDSWNHYNMSKAYRDNWERTFGKSHKRRGKSTKKSNGGETDLSKCPGCGGEADNGFDRCVPPAPYYCTTCTEKMLKDMDD